MASEIVREIREVKNIGRDCGMNPEFVAQITRWADALEVAESRIEDMEDRLASEERGRRIVVEDMKAYTSKLEKRVAELAVSEKKLVELHAKRGARIEELEAENQRLRPIIHNVNG